MSSLSPFAMSSMSSIQSVRVHFPALLEQPPVDRVRKRGLVYPKLAQSKGSGDRMHSTDLFWGCRKVSAAATISEPEPKGVVPRGTIDLANYCSLPSQPASAASTATGFLAFIRDRRSYCERLAATPSSERHHASAAPLLFGLVGVRGGRLRASSRCGYGPGLPVAAAIEDGGGPPRDSANSSVAFVGVGI
ncbi:hypothetical protein BJV78DRAFT_15927 [Lactifluus subvellereus]|nr:hypothetical protein BJV78DRAFT_15927 [Lactifluus subvellereus]